MAIVTEERKRFVSYLGSGKAGVDRTLARVIYHDDKLVGIEFFGDATKINFDPTSDLAQTLEKIAGEIWESLPDASIRGKV